jgi:hypothetical protein
VRPLALVVQPPAYVKGLVTLAVLARYGCHPRLGPHDLIVWGALLGLPLELQELLCDENVKERLRGELRGVALR